MTLKQLEAFYWAAILGSFSMASNRLNITQSTLSKRVAELETALGASLFDRSAQKSLLTEHGQRILEHVHKILQMEGELKSLISVPQPLSGICKFGISELTALTWLPKFVSEINHHHPQLILEPYVDLGSALEKKLVRGELDFAILPQSASNIGLLSLIPLATLDVAWMSSPKRIPVGRKLTIEDIQQHPVITMTSDSSLTDSFHNWALQQGVVTRRVIACNSLSAIVGLTIADVGISFLPQRFLQPMVEQGKLVTFQSDPPLPPIKYCFRWRTDDTRALVPTLAALAQQEVNYSLAYGF
jgi:DNA-binding transcriptional LysR family regulator